MKETVCAGAQPQEESAEDAGVAQQHQLMHQEMVSAISEHANDRKFAAKNAQVCLHGACHVLVSLSSFSSVQDSAAVYMKGRGCICCRSAWLGLLDCLCGHVAANPCLPGMAWA